MMQDLEQEYGKSHIRNTYDHLKYAKSSERLDPVGTEVKVESVELKDFYGYPKRPK